MFRLKTGINIVHVPYRGAAPAVTDLLAGQAQMYFESIILLPHIEVGKVRALAVADETRLAQLPSVPTTIESGFPSLQSSYSSSVLAPAGTPTSVVNKLIYCDQQHHEIRGNGGDPGQAQRQTEARIARGLRRLHGSRDAKWTAVVNAADIKSD
jgi:hypothetical protein